MTLRFVSGTNGFLPQATGQVIGYIRQPDQFPINDYVQYVETPAVVGVYAKIGRDQSVEVVSDEEFAWQDGADMPSGKHNKVPFEWTEFACFRRAISFEIGYQAIDQAKKGIGDIEPMHMNTQISRLMTLRTWRVISYLETTTNWPTGHTATANALNGGKGKWNLASDDPSSSHYNAIAESLLAAMQIIDLDTNGVVNVEDLRLVISPKLAKVMSQTAEIKNYVRQTERAAQDNISGKRNKKWGLPDYYQDIKIVVENTSRVSQRPKAAGTEATTARDYVKSQTSAILMSRKGGIDGGYRSPSFSTVQVYHYKGLMQVKGRSDDWNEKVEGAVSEQIKEVVAAGHSGCLITDCI